MDHSKFCSFLGSIFAAFRRKQGLSQYHVADASGVTRRYIQRLENGRQEASLSTVFILAKAMDISPALIIAELEKAIQGDALSDEIKEFLPPKKLGRPPKYEKKTEELE